MAEISRRQFTALALGGLGTSLLLAGCSTGGNAPAASGAAGGGNPYKAATLDFAWWGNDVRNAYTQKLIDLYKGKHSAITIQPQPGEWSSYWTKLSTQVAASDAPDLIQMDQAYIAEYGGRGALLDLSTQKALHTSNIDSGAIEAGTYDGKLYGIVTGQNAYAVVANTRLFSKAGVDLPDDDSWTWDDYRELAAKITQNTGGDVWGTAFVGQDSDLQLWLRQHGQQLYTKSGKLGFTSKNVKSWLDQAKKQMTGKAMPGADVITQDVGQALEQGLFGTGHAAMTWNWTNQISALTAATNSDVKLLKPPSVAGSSAKAGMYYKPSMFWSASAQTKFPAQAAGFIDFLANNLSAGELILAERGMPVNSKVLDHVKDMFSDADKASLEFLNAIKPDVKSTPPVPPKGTSTVTTIIRNHTSDVLFGKTDSASAAEAMTNEIKALL
jgi:multiple sugar transport system substrate-binding protein